MRMSWSLLRHFNRDFYRQELKGRTTLGKKIRPAREHGCRFLNEKPQTKHLRINHRHHFGGAGVISQKAAKTPLPLFYFLPLSLMSGK